MTDLLGRSAEELSTSGPGIIDQIIHPDDVEVIKSNMCAFRAFPEGHVSVMDIRIRAANSEWAWLRTRDSVFQRDGEGRPLQVLGSGEDVTDEKRAAAELAVVRSHLVGAIEGLHSGLVMYDAANKLVICNRTFREHYPSAAEVSVPGESFETVVQAMFGACEASADDAGPSAGLVARCAGIGVHERRIGNRWMRICDSPTEEGGFVSLHTDITEMKQAQEDLRRAGTRPRPQPA